MALNIALTLDGVKLTGKLFGTQTAVALAALLPLELSLNRWGDEYYGSIGTPLRDVSGTTQEVMAVGDLAYWEPGNAFCIFLGPTPASSGEEPVAAGPVHLVGNVGGDWQAMKALGQVVIAVLDKA